MNNNPFTSPSTHNPPITSIFSTSNSSTPNIFGNTALSLNNKPDEKSNKNGGTNFEGKVQGGGGSIFSTNSANSFQSSSLTDNSNIFKTNSITSSTTSQLFGPSNNPFSMPQHVDKKTVDVTSSENTSKESGSTNANNTKTIFGVAANPFDKSNISNTSSMFGGGSSSNNMFNTIGNSNATKTDSSSNIWKPNQSENLSTDTKTKETASFFKPSDQTATIKPTAQQNNEQKFTPPILKPLDPSIFMTTKQTTNQKNENLSKQTEPIKKNISNSEQKSLEFSFDKKSSKEESKLNYDYIERLKIDDEEILEDLRNAKVYTSKDTLIKKMKSERDKIKEGIIKNLQAEKNKVILKSHTEIATKKLEENIRGLEKHNTDLLNEKKSLEIEIEQIEKTLSSLKTIPIELPEFQTPKICESMKVEEYQEEFYKFLPDEKELSTFQKIKNLREEKERLSEEVEEAERTVNDLEFEESEKRRRLHNIDFEVIDIFNEDEEFESYCNEGFGVERENLEARYRSLKEEINVLKSKRNQNRSNISRSSLIL